MRRRQSRPIATLESLEARRVLAAAPIISEFVASNDSSLNDGFGADPDWIEIYNSGDDSIDLLGHHLTDKQDDLAKWTFTESTVVSPGEYLLVFASSNDTRDPAGFWHTNFKLGAKGEYLALSSPDRIVLSQFGSATKDYPAQFTDVSYGLGRTQLVSGESLAEYWVPTSDVHDDSWTQLDFDAVGAGFEPGQAALGFEGSTRGSNNFRPHIRTELPFGTTSTYVRAEFDLSDPSLPDLTLNLLYDDGLVIYLNGTQVFTDQDEPPTWDGISDKVRRDRVVLEGLDLNLDEHIPLLREGNNVIAFHLLNRSETSDDYLLVPSLTSSRASGAPGYLDEPTPAAPNGNGIELGPLIRNVQLETQDPAPSQPLLVTAEVSPTLSAVVGSSVDLHYRTMYEDDITIPMSDDGQGVDGKANDGVYSAQIPGGIAGDGEMVRWFVTANDVELRQGRGPLFSRPRDSAEYFGTVFPDPTASSDIPVMYWFVDRASSARTRVGTRASISIGGEFYDNVRVDLHGQSTSNFTKTSFDFDANQGQKFRVADEFDRVSDFNLLTNYGDQTKLRNSLGYGAHAASGGSHHFVIPISVHRNGEFYGLYDLVEQGDAEYLERLGRDPDGALYKINNRLDSATNNVDKVTRKFEGNDDLQELIDGADLSNSVGLVWDYDNLDIADMINYLAVQSLILNGDFGHKNMYWYLDTNGTQLWSIFPWDVDLSFGHNWNPNDTYFDDSLFTTGGLQSGHNDLLRRLYTDSRLNSMYYRRLRTIMDEQLGEEGSPIAESFVVRQVVALEAQIADVAQRDFDKWGIHPGFSHTPREATQELLDDYFERRRSHLERIRRIPDPHGPASRVDVLTVEHDPSSGRTDQQYIELRNTESFAVDMTGWRMSGATEHTFKAGSVIPADSSLYLVADPTAFKARTVGPRGGQKLLIQANSSGSFNQGTGEITLSNSQDTLISSKTFGSALQRGDTNSDGQIGVEDIDALRAAIRIGATDAVFDLDEDGSVDEKDFDVLVQDILQVTPGDTNFDGSVNFDDFLIVAENFGGTDRGWADGNFDVDDNVTFADFLSLAAVFAF